MTAAAVEQRRRFRLNRRPISPSALWWSSAVLVVMVALAVVGPLVTPYGPNDTDLTAVNGGFSSAHWLGTDALGRDILSRILTSARLTLLGPLVVMVGSTVLGALVAVSSAWIGGRFDSAVGLVTDISLAFPSLLLAVLVAAFVGPGFVAPIAAITIAYVPYTARIIRSAALAERSLPYVDALYLQGLSSATICLRHLVPNLTGVLAAISTLTYGYAMVDLAAISFLGLGVQPPDADWGSMVAQGQSAILQGAPQQSMAAGLFIVVTVIAVNILGEGLADRSSGRNR